MRSSVRSLLLGSVLFAIPVGYAFARGPGGPEGREHRGPATADEVRERMGMVAERALSKVDATAEQRTEIDALLDDAAPEAFETRQELKKLRKELRAEFVKAQLDEGKIEKLRKQGVALADEKSRAMTDLAVAVAQVLTPEQRAALGEELARRAEGFEAE